MWKLDIPNGAEPIGYRFLYEHFRLRVLGHYRWSYTGPGWESKEFKYEHSYVQLRLYPKSYEIESDPIKHVEFALKHEGLNLNIIKQSLKYIGREKVCEYIKSSPTGKYARKIWFLYEFLLEDILPIDDIGRASYVLLVNPNDYYCGKDVKSSRHRVVNNLLGNRFFAPLVRRSARLTQLEERNLSEVARNITKQYDESILARAVRYLYTKETIASWEIEREKPDKAKAARFVALLQRDYSRDQLTKNMLVSIQREIVDDRFALDDYRSFQNYVGEEPEPGEVLVHYIAPRPCDLPDLMDGLLQCASRMFASQVDSVIVAAIISFGFVFMHPFEDGNGRLHRFLIHYVLSKLGFTPQGIVFPISAVILRKEREYDRVLESFSKPLSELIENYEINDLGEMTVNSETGDFYRYVDFTTIAEFLYQCVDQTVQTDLGNELDFLSRYDVIKRQLKEVVDMPDRRIDLFIKCVRQNNGSLSTRKRSSLFKMLTEAEVDQMENIIKKNTR
ncbi:MAG: cell filamentation protein Fic [Chlamydiae bacterium CG10_big_fil_rev_8_21_14_0_10_35_9]|nr:MAG: cell filamentation protein Fic [Chlamydiae bacterium CG10_big_fil_rev_8_21_14_0_10_35_9]